MKENFRQFLDRLRQAGELVDLQQAVDIRHIATLVDQAKTALFFHNVIGYDMPVVSGIIRSKERAIMSMGCETFGEIEYKLRHGDRQADPAEIRQRLADARRGDGRRRRRSLQAADPDVVDLRRRPDDHRGRGDLQRPGARLQQRHLPLHRQGKGAHRHRHRHAEQHAAVRAARVGARASRCRSRSRSARIRSRSRARASARRSASTRWASPADCAARRCELAPCATIDVPYIADAEIVLEAEILPTGWTWPEGRFGEFTRLMGGLHWNPLVRIKAIAMRKDAVYYNLHMPWENTWLAAPTRYTAIRQALKTANVARQGHQRHARRLRVLARRHLDQEGRRRRRQERAARRAVGDGPQARRGGRRRHRRQQPDGRRMGDRHARAGRQGHRHRAGRARQAARSEPAAGRRRGADRRQGRHRRDDPRAHPEGALRAHHLCLRRDREGRRLREGQDRQGRQGGRPGARSRRWRRRSSTPSTRSRCTTPTSPSASRTTTSTPWRARSAICTRPKSCGRTRAARCACAAASSRRCCRGRSRHMRRDTLASPSPLVGEGGSERSEEPGEGSDATH